jgi:GT2 family glycosyltransferase
MMTIAALLTCHNRRDKTMACLQALMALELPQDCRLDVVLVDDGSTDGTSAAVRAAFPEVEILTGPGDLYWCGGMRVAWKAAASRDPDYYLLANDDTILDRDAATSLLELVPSAEERIIAVGAIRDPETGEPTYGGVDERGMLLPATGSPRHCRTFNGNAVLIPRAVYQTLGPFHHVYTHGMGDYDYGIQARKQGVSIIQTAGMIGHCARNPETNTWRDRSLSRAKRWKLLSGPKGLPFREWMEYNRRNTGWLWPWKSITPYLRVLLGR